MRRFLTGVLSAALVSASASYAHALDVTLDLNGFPAVSGLQVNGTGFDKVQRFDTPPPQVVITNVQPGGTYSVDFFHNSGSGSSDFGFTIDAEGKGVATVTKGGGVHDLIDGFKPGATTLKLRTFDLVYNADGAQTGQYFISGLIAAHALKANEGPQTFKAIPGKYSVDNLYNTNGGKEDYQFSLDDKGKTGPVEGYEMFATFEGSKVSQRVAWTKWTIVSPYGAINYHTSHVAERDKPVQDGDAYTYTFVMPIAVGGGGVNVWSFGDCTIDKSNLVDGKGESVTGTTTKNDGHTNPIVGHDEKGGYYFLTDKGPMKRLAAEISGMRDGGETPLAVKVSAEILPGKPKVEEEKPAE